MPRCWRWLCSPDAESSSQQHDQQRRCEQLDDGEHEHDGQHRDTSSCGPKPGVAATGTPINVGTIDTKQPGTDFSDGPNMINAYFDCVNANGGVNGHPLKLFVEYDQTDPAQIAAAAKQLIQTDHVVGIAGCSTCSSARSNRAY